MTTRPWYEILAEKRDGTTLVLSYSDPADAQSRFDRETREGQSLSVDLYDKTTAGRTRLLREWVAR